MKALLEIEPPQVDILKELCAREGVSRAEAIRRAIDYYGAHMLPAAPLDAHFGHWKNRKIDALSYVDKLRDEW
jgi:hypothetical protein